MIRKEKEKSLVIFSLKSRQMRSKDLIYRPMLCWHREPFYTDLIESGKGVGKKAHVIKSHHNVKSPLVEAKRLRGEIIEPLDCLYKDEVRKLGEIAGLSNDIIYRHPFPGPGLAVRILGEITREKCDLLREVDHIYIEQLKKRDLYSKIWQAFSVLLPLAFCRCSGRCKKIRTGCCP